MTDYPPSTFSDYALACLLMAVLLLSLATWGAGPIDTSVPWARIVRES